MKGELAIDGKKVELTIESSLGDINLPDAEKEDCFVSVKVDGKYFDGFLDRVKSKDER